MGVVLQSCPATGEITSHTHGMDKLCVLLTGGEQPVGPCARGGCILHGVGRPRVVDQGHEGQKQRTRKAKRAKVGVQHIEHAKIKRDPGCVEKGKQGGTGDEITQARHIRRDVVGCRLALHTATYG